MNGRIDTIRETRMRLRWYESWGRRVEKRTRWMKAVRFAATVSGRIAAHGRLVVLRSRKRKISGFDATGETHCNGAVVLPLPKQGRALQPIEGKVMILF